MIKGLSLERVETLQVIHRNGILLSFIQDVEIEIKGI